jgi:hypothetical protein
MNSSLKTADVVVSLVLKLVLGSWLELDISIGTSLLLPNYPLIDATTSSRWFIKLLGYLLDVTSLT